MPVWERTGKWARRRPVHAALALLLGFLGAAVPAGLEWSRLREIRRNEELGAAIEQSHRSESEARAQRALADRERLLAYRRLAANQLKLAGSLADQGEYEPVISILDSLDPPRELHLPRGFPWNHLDWRVRRPARPLAVLPDIAAAVACRADGRMIALTDHANNTYLLDGDFQTATRLPGQHQLKDCQRLVFAPDGRTLASLSHGFSRETWNRSEIRIWNTATGAEVEGMADDAGHFRQIAFTRDGGALLRLAVQNSKPQSSVQVWSFSADRRRLTMTESVRGDQLAHRLARDRARPDRGAPSLELSDVLSVSYDPSAKTAVWLEDGAIEIYTDWGYCLAFCRALDSEVVFTLHYDGHVSYTTADIEKIGRALVCIHRASACQTDPSGHTGPGGALLGRRTRSGLGRAIPGPAAHCSPLD